MNFITGYRQPRRSGVRSDVLAILCLMLTLLFIGQVLDG